MQKIVLGVAGGENTEQKYLLTSRCSESSITDDLMHSDYSTFSHFSPPESCSLPVSHILILQDSA